MPQYLLSIYQPDGDPPPAEVLEPIMKNLAAVNQEMKSAGAWVFAGGLHPPSTATVVRARDGDTLITDGPYIEGREHLGGFTVIEAADLDSALVWGGKLAEAIGLLPIEVRPLADEADSCDPPQA
ncbi:YciI family protein [Plantactinospora solaniradicis]|uniref:YciI family protein n=1 Tax=Plantactinospora solaniradicis TaxID=1723736 RepID=A0ABW1K750_9ACTN